MLKLQPSLLCSPSHKGYCGICLFSPPSCGLINTIDWVLQAWVVYNNSQIIKKRNLSRSQKGCHSTIFPKKAYQITDNKETEFKEKETGNSFIIFPKKAYQFTDDKETEFVNCHAFLGQIVEWFIVVSFTDSVSETKSAGSHERLRHDLTLHLKNSSK